MLRFDSKLQLSEAVTECFRHSTQMAFVESMDALTAFDLSRIAEGELPLRYSCGYKTVNSA